MKTTLLHSLLLAGGLFSCASATPSDFIVASNLPAAITSVNGWEEVGLISPNYRNYNNDSKGQAFTASFSGMLTTVEALVAASTGSPIVGSPTLNVSLYSSSNGLPNSLLATLQFPATDFDLLLYTTNKRKTFDFSPLHVPLAAGQQYLVAFETPFGFLSPDGTKAPFYVGASFTFDPVFPLSLGQNTSFAPDGHNWQLFTDEELGITVRATPEPQSAALLVAGLIFVGLRRRSVPHGRV